MDGRLSAGQKSSRTYLLAILTVVVFVCNLDRMIINVLLVPIGREFALNDMELGLLAGIAFTALYSVGGIFAGRASEKMDRISIVAVAVTVWSAMTALGGIATSFALLLSARLGVGLAEAACQPPSHSLLADEYAPAERPLALGFYSVGVYAGAVVGLPLGGWLAQAYGWRVALCAVGLPGILIGAILRLTLKDPRVTTKASIATSPRSESAVDAIRKILGQREVRHTIAAAVLINAPGSALLAFFPAVLIRTHHVTQAQSGLYFGIILGSMTLLGSLLGGWVTSRLARKDVRWTAWVQTVCQASSCVFGVLCLWSPSLWLALLCLAPFYFLASSWMGATFTLIQDASAPGRRATAAALLLLTYNLLGFGLGPLVAGALSDRLRPFVGGDSIRYALMLMLPLTLWGALHYYLAGKAMAPPLSEPAAAE